MKIANTNVAFMMMASLSLIISASLIADDQKGDNKKGGNKQSGGQQHSGKAVQQAPPRTAATQRQQAAQQQAPPRAASSQKHQQAPQPVAAPQRQQRQQVVQQQAAPRRVSQQVSAVPRGSGQNSKHGNPSAIQQSAVSRGANQGGRPAGNANPRIVSQNPQVGVSAGQKRGNRGNPVQAAAVQQGYNGVSRSAYKSSGVVAAPRVQSINGGGYQQYQVTPNAQYNRNNNYGGLWTQANTHNDWNHNGQHYWNNHNYRWYEGGWLIIDGFFNPYYSNGNVGYYNNASYGSTASSVQSRLAELGYYNGSIDGDVGPGTRNAIVNFQRDNNLYVSGRITNELLQSLQLL
jgi:hypothetical protein